MHTKPALVRTNRRANAARSALAHGGLAMLLATLCAAIRTAAPQPVGPPARPTRAPGAHAGLAAVLLPLRRLLRRPGQIDQALIRDMTSALSQTRDLAGLDVLLLDYLPQQLGLDRAVLWALDPPDDLAFVASALGDNPDATILSDGDSARQIRQAAVYLVVPHPAIGWARPFQQQQLDIVLPLRVGGQLIGIYGCRSRQRSSQQQTIELLLTIAPAVASAMEHVRAHTKIAHLHRQIQALDQLKEQFVASMSHELRTPLTTLSLAMHLLARQPESAAALADISSNSVAQLQAMVGRVMAFEADARGRPDKQAEPIELIDLGAALAQLAACFKPIAATKGIRLRVEAAAGLAAWGSPTRLRRALHEIVDNAVRYSDGGEVVFSATLNDGLAILSVSDQGPGIPIDDRARVFEPFFRSDLTRGMASTPGAGLGLSIARQDIATLDGRVWLGRSGPNGSVVCIAIPAAQAYAVEEKARAVGE